MASHQREGEQIIHSFSFANELFPQAIWFFLLISSIETVGTLANITYNTLRQPFQVEGYYQVYINHILHTNLILPSTVCVWSDGYPPP